MLFNHTNDETDHSFKLLYERYKGSRTPVTEEREPLLRPTMLADADDGAVADAVEVAGDGEPPRRRPGLGASPAAGAAGD